MDFLALRYIVPNVQPLRAGGLGRLSVSVLVKYFSKKEGTRGHGAQLNGLCRCAVYILHMFRSLLHACNSLVGCWLGTPVK